MKKITLVCVFAILGFLAEAQPVSGYAFVQSTEVYAPVAGTNSTAVGDDGFQNSIAIGFPFFFGGEQYTTLSISTNGFVRLGNDIGGQSWINNFSNTLAQAPVIAAFWDDNNRNSGSIQYALSGVSPNQFFEVGWHQVNIGNNGQTNNAVSASFKIRLHESGTIEMIYGPQMTWSGGITGSIGLNDLTSFLSVTPAAGTATVSSTTANTNILSTVDIVNNKYVFTPPPLCEGAPSPGNTLASVASICSGHEFSLSVENVTIETGITYQWQSSENGVDFTDIADATDPSITVTQSAEMFYRCIVTCAFGSSTATTPVIVPMNDAENCWCFPSYTFGKTDGDLISNVVIAGTTLANNTGTSPINPSYTYFTGQPNYTAELEAGTSYEIQVTAGSYGNQNSAVWIDFNDDNVFGDDERIGYTIAGTGAFGTAVYTIQLTCDAPLGVHRMRIRDVWNVSGIDIDPCANYGYGETEDYDITVIPQSACPVATDLAVPTVTAYAAVLVWNSGCGQTNWDVHVAPAGGGTPVGAPSHPNASSPLTVENLDALTAYEFYVLSHCDTIGNSIWAGPFAFTTAPEPVANDECDTAFTLQVGSSFDEYAVVSTNVGATESIAAPDPECAAFNFGGDVWYSIVVPASGNLTVETRLETGSPVSDTGLSVYSGECGALVSLGCSDDEGDGAFSKMELTGLTPGATVYARVWEYANDAIGAFRLSAWDDTLGNDSFDQAGFAFYPNPVTNWLNISYLNGISEIRVFNLLGGQMLVKSVGTDEARIDMSSLSAGVYMVKVLSQGQTKTIKVVKE